MFFLLPFGFVTVLHANGGQHVLLLKEQELPCGTQQRNLSVASNFGEQAMSEVVPCQLQHWSVELLLLHGWRGATQQWVAFPLPDAAHFAPVVWSAHRQLAFGSDELQLSPRA